MITDLTTSILYICPECSSSSLKTLSAFEIKKNEPLSLTCSKTNCSYANADIQLLKDKYKINIDCPICGDEHSFTLSKKTLWNKDFLILNCPQSGFGVLFIGKDKSRLIQEYAAQAEVIAGIIAANDEAYDELDILFEIIETLNSFAQNGAIHCSCENENIAININTDSATLSCKNCGKSITFNAQIDVLKSLSEVDEIIIE